MFIDLHTHSYPSSDDSFLSPDELIEAAKNAGLDGICLTEHDHFWDPSAIASLSAKHSFPVFPGCEVNTDDGHVLVFGLESYIFGMHKSEFLRRHVDAAGGVMVAAHPYRRRYLKERAHLTDDYSTMVEKACADRFFGFCDAIEGLNGRASAGQTAFSTDLAGRLGLGMVGASDSHRLKHMGGAATRFENKIGNVQDLIREIKAARYEAVSIKDNAARELATGSSNPMFEGS